MKNNSSKLVRKREKGLYCQYGDFWIDPNRPVKTALITHAHFDHFAIGCEKYICSYETEILLKERIGQNINIESFRYEETFTLEGINISFIPKLISVLNG